MIDSKTPILPCPFCGNRQLDIGENVAPDDNNRVYAYYVFCPDCHAHGRNHYPISWCESEEAAIEAWNDRFVPATIPDENGRVQLSIDALLLIRRELKNISDIKNHIDDLLTPIQMFKDGKND